MGGDRLSGKKKYNNGTIVKYFYPGEQPDGWILGSLEAKKLKNAAAQKRNWENAEYRARQVASHNTDEYVNRVKTWNQQAWQKDRAARAAALKAAKQKYFETPEAHEMRRNVQKNYGKMRSIIKSIVKLLN